MSLALVITQTPWVQRHNALPWRRSWCRGRADSHASPCCPGSCTPSSARASRLIFHWVDVFRTLQIVQIYWCFQCYICEFQDFWQIVLNPVTLNSNSVSGLGVAVHILSNLNLVNINLTHCIGNGRTYLKNFFRLLIIIWNMFPRPTWLTSEPIQNPFRSSGSNYTKITFGFNCVRFVLTFFDNGNNCDMCQEGFFLQKLEESYLSGWSVLLTQF